MQCGEEEKRGGKKAKKETSHVVLQIGPRLELEVVKVEEGMCEGKVLFHSFVHKSAGEAAKQQQHVSQKAEEEQLRAKRRHQQVCLLFTAAA